VIVEHPMLTAAHVAAVVVREWQLEVTAGRHVADTSSDWHVLLEDADGPHWLATLHRAPASVDRTALLDAWQAAGRLQHGLGCAVAPVPTRDARVAVDVAPRVLLTVAPHVEGEQFPGDRLADDDARCLVAGALGELHALPRPRRLPVWRPSLGRDSKATLADLERCLAEEDWDAGPWSGPASRLVAESRPVLGQALRRFRLLGAAVAGTPDRWVVTHGAPYGENLVRTDDGLRLLEWTNVALAPRERDLFDALGEAEGDEPWFAYLAAGGRPDPLAPDTVELFALERHLRVVCANAVGLSRSHQDSEDDRRCFTDLERELGTLVSGWT
jgi:hypothetical protein